MISTDEVAAVTGTTYREIDHWVRKGYIDATRASRGTGHPRGFSVEDVIFAACVATLVRFGVRPNVAAVVMRNGGCLEGGDVVVKLDVVAVRARVVEILGQAADLRLVP